MRPPRFRATAPVSVDAQPHRGSRQRRLPIGAEVVPGGVHFRVWAPRCRKIALAIDSERLPLDPREDGYFDGLCETAGPGTHYRFQLDDTEYLYPDPASRFQPEGP